MTIYQARDSKLSTNKRLEIYKKNNVLDKVSKTEVVLGFDEGQFFGKGKTTAQALKDAEKQWRKDNELFPERNPFTRCWG